MVGSVDGGVMGAAWSPDDTLLVLVTGGSINPRDVPLLITQSFLSGEDKLLVMTSTFDVISEGPLHPAEFGEGSWPIIT